MYLDGQFTCWRQYHGAYLVLLAVFVLWFGQQVIHAGDHKSSRFTGASLCFTGDIFTGQSDRNALRLDGGAKLKASLINAFEQIWVEVEVFKAYFCKVMIHGGVAYRKSVWESPVKSGRADRL